MRTALLRHQYCQTCLVVLGGLIRQTISQLVVVQHTHAPAPAIAKGIHAMHGQLFSSAYSARCTAYRVKNSDERLFHFIKLSSVGGPNSGPSALWLCTAAATASLGYTRHHRASLITTRIRSRVCEQPAAWCMLRVHPKTVQCAVRCSSSSAGSRRRQGAGAGRSLPAQTTTARAARSCQGIRVSSSSFSPLEHSGHQLSSSAARAALRAPVTGGGHEQLSSSAARQQGSQCFENSTGAASDSSERQVSGRSACAISSSSTNGFLSQPALWGVGLRFSH